MDIEKLLVPFWEGEDVFNETVMLLSEKGEIPNAPLFYEPKKIISVKSTDFKISRVRMVISPKFPMGVGHKYKVPLIVEPPFHRFGEFPRNKFPVFGKYKGVDLRINGVFPALLPPPKP